MRLLFEIDKKDYEPGGKAFVRPSSRGIILRDGKVAVIYSRKYGFYKIPGGGIDEGESKEQAMIREVREEAGLIVKPETVREYGYVHRIQKGKHEPVFIQDNFYYFCEVEEKTVPQELSKSEVDADFEARFMDIEDVIAANNAYVEAHPEDTMIDRETKILKMILEEKLV